MKRFLMTLYTVMACVSFFAFALGPALAYFRVLQPDIGFFVFAGGCLLGSVVAIAGAIAMLRGQSGAVVAVWFLGAVPAGFLAYGVVDGRNYPLINDISSSTVYPPQFVHTQTMEENESWDLSFPAKNREIINEHYPEIQSLPLPGPIDDVYARAHQLAKAQPGWVIMYAELGDEEHTIEGYEESRVFRFRDYFVIRIKEVEDGLVLVDMRSKSKYGQGDFGVNAARIRDFFEKLKA